VINIRQVSYKYDTNIPLACQKFGGAAVSEQSNRLAMGLFVPGASIDKAIDWAAGELEGFMRT
jgi:hypothetical protein